VKYYAKYVTNTHINIKMELIKAIFKYEQ